MTNDFATDLWGHLIERRLPRQRLRQKQKQKRRRRQRQQQRRRLLTKLLPKKVLLMLRRLPKLKLPKKPTPKLRRSRTHKLVDTNIY